ncbi:putative xaa-pro dipeptidase [Drepanopeziza brunnea f. sp. 'multigermtubi' MB_m1]|uniref:Xaa-Pro aminopeptidase n=1 Tax=Marssonina brunnea f. sp. multigermtubi (strain MB_m1) TaxID=1072389 RepID=K1X3E5_MARBU|nr:putative xaa-pro dipeptidase [Drepanopeziza brunnea f. sp. 'multigermtubi' MB_m1]EKD15218.1 putative xaa-pro dipeptidase [Drepanopeziza brunnea f. sp. 'multigermtubi' MB_m1]
MKLRGSGLQQLRKVFSPARPRGLLASATASRTHVASHPQRTYATVSAADLQFGQPVYETHPHLLKPGEITAGITAQEYADRRSRLAASLPANGIAILASSDTKYRSGAVFYEFHQEPNFLYLTGFNEPDAVAVIQRVGPSSEYIFHLFLRPKDPKAEQWEGARSGEQAALDVFNADESGDINRLHALLPPLISGASEVYTDVTKHSGFGRFLRKQDALPTDFQIMIKDSKVKSLKPLMHELRVIKSEAEIANLRLAGKYSGRAITNAMRHRWTREKDLGAFLDYDFKGNGCDTTAYIPVIAGGRNALAIHYVRNDNVLHDGQIVLVDAGGEYGGYIADITRSWPINGRFSDAQKDLYEAILRVQRSSVSLCRESANMTLDKIHEVTEHGLKEALKQLGFDMKGDAMYTLFPHHVGHYIGLDVHDCPGYSRSVPLKAGHCVTVEPGIYVPDDERWPAHFRGMGIRIEDSVCVQDDSPLVLTTEAVKEVVDIEALRN